MSNNMFTSLFQDEGIEYKTCVKCKVSKPYYDFQIDNKKRSAIKRRSNCKDCGKKATAEVDNIRYSAPPKPEACEFCGRTDGKLRLDHCHSTKQFRAWLCNKCNTGFAQLGDTSEAIEKAWIFIKDREDRIKLKLSGHK